MGIFDLLRSVRQATEDAKNSTDTPEQEALRLIDAGNVLDAESRTEEAMQHYLEAIRLAPRLARAHLNHGNSLLAKGDVKSALEAYEKAIKHKPDYSSAYYNIGNVLLGSGQFDNGVIYLRRALEIEPALFEAHYDLGCAQQKHGQFEEAVASFRRTLEINPHYAEAHSHLLYALNFIASLTPSYCLEQAREYGRMVAGKAATCFSTWQCAAQPERLRVGLVSGDLRIHSVGYFLEGLLSQIDSARIELIAYPTCCIDDELTARIRPNFSAWKSLFDKSDETAARLIHADGVHILLDLSGHTGHNRLPVFAWKPAPIQATWLGLPFTTGVAEIDYVIGDLHAIPPEHEHHFSEAVWRLPNSYLCFTAPSNAINVSLLPALVAGYVTFGSFNNLSKMNDTVVKLWARILLSVPKSRLFLKADQLNDAGICEQTRRRFAFCGIASDRLLLNGALASRDGHLAAYNNIDIALDTFPYPGVTTSVEALWMGVPVLSLQGDRFLSRTSASIAHNAGLPGWVAADEDDYVAKAVAFASDLECLAALRANLRQQVLASPMFDSPRFARSFEDALWGMWQARRSDN